MNTQNGSSQPAKAGKPQPGGVSRAVRSAQQQQLQPGERTLPLADFERAIAVMETTGRIEMQIAAALRAMAAEDGSDATARQRRLAEVAMGAAQVAVDHSERMRQQARAWSDHADVAALWQSLEDACWLLVDLARTEELMAGILRTMADRGGSGPAAERRRLADQAAANAQHHHDRARGLRELAQSSEFRPQHRPPVPGNDAASAVARPLVVSRPGMALLSARTDRDRCRSGGGAGQRVIQGDRCQVPRAAAPPGNGDLATGL
jgi:hypothetical protein